MNENDANSKDFEYEYNPVKELKEGEKAKAVVWSTKSINKALDAIKKGLPLKTNPFIGTNTKLLKPELVYKRTEEEIEEYMHCMQDIIYFASKCYITQPEGLLPCVLRDYLITYLKSLQENRFNILRACRQAGKSVTTAIFGLWYCLFLTDVNGLILSKSGPAGVDLLSKIKDMFLNLPYYLKPGVTKWNLHEIAFDSNSTMHTEAFSDTAGLGQTINFLILDEFAWTPPTQCELFYQNVIPTVTTMPNSRVCIMSTQNGFNLFYKIFIKSLKGENAYANFTIDWDNVPNWDPENKKWVKRDEKWKQMMIGVLGSESAFYYLYGTMFLASDYCLVSKHKMQEIHKGEISFIIKDLGYPLFCENLFWNPNFNLEELKTAFFFILCDLAEGGGGDYTIFNIMKLIDKDKFELVGYWRCNTKQLETAALCFWLMYAVLFNNERCLISIEWNTYGALFYKIIENLNEQDEYVESSYRFLYAPDGIDMANVVYYTNDSVEKQIADGHKKVLKFIPGIRFNSSNKITACSMLKMNIENGNIIITDIEAITELENFEDKNGNGTYKASFGHDDIIMTFCQIPMLMQTTSYQSLIEDFIANKISNNIQGINNRYEDIGGDLWSINATPKFNPFISPYRNNDNSLF